MSERERDLVAGEGVDEGSAATTDEAAGHEHDVVGRAGGPRPEHDAGPEPVETPESRRATEGQQLEMGEG